MIIIPLFVVAPCGRAPIPLILFLLIGRIAVRTNRMDAQAQGPAAQPEQDAQLAKDILETYKTKSGYRLARTYIDFAVDKEPLGRVEVDLPVIDKCPKTSANFLALCQGGYTDLSGNSLHYKGKSLFKLVPKFCVCGGDVTNDNGTGGISIYSQATFADETSGLNHDKPGIVAMLPQGNVQNANGSQFTILLSKAPWLDKLYVPFGFVSSGLDFVESMAQKFAYEKVPAKRVVRIFDCGIK